MSNRTRTALQTLRDRARAERAAANPRGVTELDEKIDAYDERDNARWRHDRLLDILHHIADRLPLYPRTGTVGPQVVSLPGESAAEHAARQAERDAEGAHVSAVQEEKARKALSDSAREHAWERTAPRACVVEPHAEDRAKPPPGWKTWPWASKSWAYGRQGEADARNVFAYNDDAIAACWAEVDRERENETPLPTAGPRSPRDLALQAVGGDKHNPRVTKSNGFARVLSAIEEAQRIALQDEAERTRKAVDAAIAEDRAMVQRSNENPVLDAQFRSALAQRVWLAGKAATAVELAFAICPDQAGGHEMVLALIDHAKRIGANEERERLAKVFDDEHRCNTAAHIRDSKP